MKLSALLAGYHLSGPDCDITGLASDSRKVRPGDAFFAVPGTHADGLAYVPQALKAGARAIISEQPAPDTRTSWIEVADMRAALSEAAASFYPRQPETIVAITGTSGKTSIAAFVRQIWLHLGYKAASLGTIGVVAPDGAVYGSLTTPDPITLHETLDRLAGQGVTHLAMEASSHGLDQKRLDGVRLKAAAFSNLSRDHLDYHATLEDYLKAKLRLFDTLLQPGQTAVVDADSSVAQTVIAACRQRGLAVFTTGRAGTDLELRSAQAGDMATRLEIGFEGRVYCVNLPLLGDFQVSNALLAAGLCLATGGEWEPIVAALENLSGAPGRLERVGSRSGAPIFIDYAHKPDALEKVLTTLRPLTQGRLVVVFGCGGDRDKGKRPIMGAIAARLADIVIVTDDNPRSENPATIRAEILTQAPQAIEIGDRQSAVNHAVSLLKAGDILLIAGKGHETGQIIGDVTVHFSDHEAVQAALREIE